MKRITLHLAPTLIVPDDTSATMVALHVINVLEGLPNVEAIGVAPSETRTVREGICAVGGHLFPEPEYFPADRPLPDKCSEHARIQKDDDVSRNHLPLFEEIERLTGLQPRIWHSGGGTMTIVIPVQTLAPGVDWSPPCYLGLREGFDGEGGWYGGIGYYATADDLATGDEIPIVQAETAAQHPVEWAQQIADHHATLIASRHPPAAPDAPADPMEDIDSDPRQS